MSSSASEHDEDLLVETHLVDKKDYLQNGLQKLLGVQKKQQGMCKMSMMDILLNLCVHDDPVDIPLSSMEYYDKYYQRQEIN